jgi:hypothetical protein
MIYLKKGRVLEEGVSEAKIKILFLFTYLFL